MKFALRWLSWIGIFLAATVTAWPQAENYPSRTITVVVPFPAGGLTDVPMRLAASLLQEKIGQPVVIENRTGGSGTKLPFSPMVSSHFVCSFMDAAPLPRPRRNVSSPDCSSAPHRCR